MRKIELRCPECSNIGNIEVDENIILNNERGITSIDIEPSTVCEHSFVVYIDTNFAMRDCFLTDYRINLPKIEFNKQDASKTDYTSEFDAYILFINLKLIDMAKIIRGILFEKRILLINDLSIIKNHLIKFLEYIFKDTFGYEVLIVEPIEYKKKKKQFKEYFIINISKFRNKKDDQKELKKMVIELKIIEKIFSEPNPKTALIVVKNEILKLYVFCNEIMKIFNISPKEKKMGKKELINLLNDQYEIKIQYVYLEFLLEILRKYYKYRIEGLSNYYIPELGL